MQIGFSINEILCLLTLTTGACWLTWRIRWARQPKAAQGKQKFLITQGAELFFVVASMFACRVAVADWPKVPTSSMEPTLRVGDYLLANHLAYGPRLPFTNTAIEWGQPQRGDVVVFRYPKKVSDLYVKRLIGLPGDQVQFDEGVVRINGEPTDITQTQLPRKAEDLGQQLIQESSLGHQRTIKINPFISGRMPLNWNETSLAEHCTSDRTAHWRCTVPNGQYLMLGDNRDNSADSREWGFLPHEQIYGKAVRVLVNFSDFSRSWTAL